jgi:hypothetical protein
MPKANDGKDLGHPALVAFRAESLWPIRFSYLFSAGESAALVRQTLATRITALGHVKDAESVAGLDRAASLVELRSKNSGDAVIGFTSSAVPAWPFC